MDPSGVQTGFKAIAHEQGAVGDPEEVILAFGGSDGGPLANPTDWVSHTQHLGWNQWELNRPQIFQYLNTLPPDTKITFTGQSLGGALAQYAAYEWIKSKTTPDLPTLDSTFDKSRINLVTFNAFGGYLALNDPTKGGGYRTPGRSPHTIQHPMSQNKHVIQSICFQSHPMPKIFLTLIPFRGNS